MDPTFTKEYEVLEELGQGKFDIVVRRCKSRANGEIYIVKSATEANADKKLSLTNEEDALLYVSHTPKSSSHVTGIYSTLHTKTHFHVIIDYCPYPTLHDLLNTRLPLPENTVKQITYSLLQAVLFCHSRGIAHRDIRPENILVDLDTNQVKLCNFGSARLYVEGMREVVGSPYYVAPEVLERREEGYNEKVDVWSVGVVLYEMVAGIPPFTGKDKAEVFESVLGEEIRFPINVFGRVSDGLMDFLWNLLRRNVERRFFADEALQHPWITNGGQSTTK